MQSANGSFNDRRSENVFYAQDISNDHNLDQSKTSLSKEAMMSKGFKKIKEKK